MRTAKTVGRLTGILLVIQLAGFIVPFILLHPLTIPDYLANAAGFSSQIKLAVFLLFANCTLMIGISILVFPIFRNYSQRLSIWLIAVSVILFTLQANDNVLLMSMISLSQRYVEAGRSNELFQSLAIHVRATRRWAHLPVLVAIDVWMFTLFSLLYRFALVPRFVSAFGWSTVLLHFVAIPLPLILGYSAVMPLGAVMALGQLTLAGWLIVKGFEDDKGATI